jgi:hypothetical protein
MKPGEIHRGSEYFGRLRIPQTFLIEDITEWIKIKIASVYRVNVRRTGHDFSNGIPIS